MKLFGSILLFVVFLHELNAQTNKTHQLSGKIIDNTGDVVSYAAIAAFKTSDSSYVSGAASDMNGNYSLKLTNGNYYIKVSFLSFENKIIPNVKIENKDIKLPPIKLVPSSLKIEEFEFVDEKKIMEIDLDKKVFNIDKDITSQGSNAAEILNNVPSVSVDVDGNVSLRGSGNVRILINGKPSGLTGTNTADAIRQLQGSQIEKIEVISNPSARYDAEGEVGIINIVLKKDNRQGINGSVNVDFGYPSFLGGGFNLSYKKKNITVFTGLGSNYRESVGVSNFKQTFTYPDTSFKYVNKTDRLRAEQNNNFRLGTEIYLNEKNSFTLSGSGNLGTGYNTVDVDYTDYNEQLKPVQLVTRNEYEDKDLNSYDLAFNYRKTFEQKDRLLTFDAQYSSNTDNEKSIIVQNNSVDMNDNTYSSVFNNEGSKNILLQTDYIHPFENKGKLEMGFRGNYKSIDDDYAVSTLNKTTGQFEIYPGFKNLMYYYENISAAYIMYGQKINKFSYQIGLRTEHSNVSTKFVATNETNNRNYTNLFPSTHLSYQIKGENAIQFSYSKRIKRPHHWSLLPFYGISDIRNNFFGNPKLNPEYTDALELGYMNYFKKGSLLSSVYYRYSTGVTEHILISSGTGTTSRIPINLGYRNSYGIEFSGSYQLFKWWDLRGDLNFYRAITDGNYLGVSYFSDTYSWSNKLTSKWNIKKLVGIQSSFDFNAPQKTTQGEDYARYGLNLGVSVDVLKGNGTINFNINDVFNSRRRRGTSYGENFYSESDFQWNSRSFRISFTYRINQTKKQAERNNRNNSFDEGGGGGM